METNWSGVTHTGKYFKYVLICFFGHIFKMFFELQKETGILLSWAGELIKTGIESQSEIRACQRWMD